MTAPVILKVGTKLEEANSVVALELKGHMSVEETLFQIEETFNIVHEKWPTHRIRHQLANGTNAWLSKAKSIAEQAPPIAEGDVLILTGKIKYDIGVSGTKVYTLDEFELIKNLGAGGFGEVCLYKHKVSGEEFAIKTITSWDVTSRSYVDLVREVSILRDAHHHAVLGLNGLIEPVGAFGKPSLVLPFMEKDSIAKVVDRIRKKEKVDWWTYTAKYIALYGTALGMEYLHSLGVIHRDIKPENILLDRNCDPKVTDFGLSKVMTKGTTVEQSHFGGTLFYQAPEVLVSDNMYTQKVDVYSFGIMMFVVFTGLEPFPKTTAWTHATKVVTQNVRPNIPGTIPRALADLMRNCWEGAPESRFTFQQVVEAMETPGCLQGVDLPAFQKYQARAKVPIIDQEPERIIEGPPPEPDPMEVLKAQADSGNAADQVRYANELLTGKNVARNPDAAFEYLLKAEEQGDKEAKVKIGELLIDKIVEHGLDDKGRRREAYTRFNEIYQSISDKKDEHRLRAGFQIGRCHQHGWRVLPDERKAFSFFEECAVNGHPESEVRYALFLELGKAGRPADSARALEFYKRASDHAFPEGMFYYATRLQNGNGVPQNVVEAVRLYALAANHGYSVAFFTLWAIYTNGIDPVAPNAEQALFYLRRGAEEGVIGCLLEYIDCLANGPDAAKNGAKIAELREQALGPGRVQDQIMFGRMYEHGGVWDRNIDRAILLYETAHRHKPTIGFYELGRILVEKRPDTRMAEGIALLREGIAKNSADCSYFLGRCLRLGVIKEQEPEEARIVLEKAAAVKHPQATIELGKWYLKARTAPALVYRFFNQAYLSGSARGAKWLSRCFKESWGVAKDDEKAKNLEAERARRIAAGVDEDNVLVKSQVIR